MSIAWTMFLGFQVVASECLRHTSRPDFLTVMNAWFFAIFVVLPSIAAAGVGLEPGESLITSDWTMPWLMAGHAATVAGWTTFGQRGSIPAREICTRSSCLRGVRLLSALAIAVALALAVAQGDPREVVTSRSLARHGGSAQVELAWSFLVPMLELPAAVLVVVAGVLLQSSSRREVADFTKLLVLNALMLTFAAIQAASRGVIAGAILSIAIAFLRCRRSLGLAALALALVLGCLLVLGKPAIYGVATLVQGGSFSDAYGDLKAMREASLDAEGVARQFVTDFRHSIHSLDFAISSGSMAVPWTYFGDFPEAALRIVPQRLRGITPDSVQRTISLANTFAIYGIEIASVPPGLVAHCYYAAGGVGVCIGMFAFGAIARMLDRALGDGCRRDSSFFGLYAMAACHYGSFLSNGDPHVYLYSALVLFATWLVLRRDFAARAPRPRGFKAAPLRSTVLRELSGAP